MRRAYRLGLLSRPMLILHSDLRQVPDTQEVLLYPDSDVSIVVEILQSVEPTDRDGIAK